MRTITFYSYKGGVGRTLTAANFALYLAKLGHRTAVIDFDLDAPGLDSKLPNCNLPNNCRGVLDYVLEYQRTGEDPGEISAISIHIPVQSSSTDGDLWLIPAGDYLKEDYSRKLDELNWKYLFSEARQGVAFFQNMLKRIERELHVDFLIVDSRTGISEIGGLCTQQLADEVVVFTGLSSESRIMTKRIAELIRGSSVADALGKTIDVKIVVSRIPRPPDLSEFMSVHADLFGIAEEKLFVVFSRPELESDEFLAIETPFRDQGLVDDYVRLFYGLNIELANSSIVTEIEKTIQDLLVSSPEETELRVVELAAFYPHPDVYDMAMRFYRLVHNQEALREFGAKLLDLEPNHYNAHSILARSFLQEFSDNGNLSDESYQPAANSISTLYMNGDLNLKELIEYAAILELNQDHSESLDIAIDLLADERINADQRSITKKIAARSAMKCGFTEMAKDFVDDFSNKELIGELASVAIETRLESNGIEDAYLLAKQLIEQQPPSPEGIDWFIIDRAADMASTLHRSEELEEVIRQSDVFQFMSRRPLTSLRRTSMELRRLGFNRLAREIEPGRPLGRPDSV